MFGIPARMLEGCDVEDSCLKLYSNLQELQVPILKILRNW